MIRKYLHLYDELLKEFHVPEDKAKEMIIGVYESAGMGMREERQLVLRASPEDILRDADRMEKLADQKHRRKIIMLYIYQVLAYLIITALFFFFLSQHVVRK